jgi:hypothetical protein
MNVRPPAYLLLVDRKWRRKPREYEPTVTWNVMARRNLNVPAALQASRTDRIQA